MKRLVSGITIMALLVMTVATGTAVSFAGTSESEGLQKAIATVKTAVDIPADLSEFSYYTDENAADGGGWNLNWTSKDQDQSISASLKGTDTITSYYCYLKDFNGESGLAKITKDQAQKVANETLWKMLPKYAQNMKLEENNTVNMYDNDYSFLYKMYMNDVPCDFITVSIDVNKYVGKLSRFSYNCDPSDFSITGYPAKDKILDQKAGGDAYIKELGPVLKYFSNYDYTKKKLTVYPAYEIGQPYRAIDAQTGKAVTLYQQYRLYATKDAAAGGGLVRAESASNIQYTEQEMNEIEKTSGLLSKTEADQKAKDLVSTLRGETLNGATLSKDNGPDQNYIWDLGYKDGYVTLDAKTGVLLNFYSYSEYSTSKKDIGLTAAKKIADDYLQKVSGDKVDQVALSNANDNTDSADYTYRFVYTRQVNGVPFDNNAISIYVDKQSGTIFNYTRTWYESAQFPSVKGAITKEAAFDAADKFGTFGLSYRKISADKVALVYQFLKADNYRLDAFTGKQLSWTGTAYEDPNQEYTDIAGTWAEKIILDLKSNGYYLAGNQFAPKAKTTQIEFFRYLYSPEQTYYNSDEDFYNMLVSQKIIKKEEINASAAITRQDAAKFIVRYLGYDKLASKPTIFKNMYKDKIDNNYLGYVASAYGLGIMKGDAKGHFNGTNTLSHAEAAVVIYNTLNVK